MEIYDPATQEWRATGRARQKRRYSHTTTTLNDGRVLLVGGYSDDVGYLDDVEIYDPATNVWSDTNSLGTRRAGHTATLLPDGRVLVVGGGGSDSSKTSAELFNPATGNWTNTGGLATERALHAASLFDIRDVPLPVG